MISTPFLAALLVVALALVVILIPLPTWAIVVIVVAGVLIALSQAGTRYTWRR